MDRSAKRARWGVFLIALGAVAVTALPAQADGEGCSPTTVLAVRHAEKAADPPGDPLLSDAGKARAAELSRIAAPAGIDAIYVTATHRTRRTAVDLAARLELTPTEISPLDTEKLVDRIRAEHAGQAVLYVGHSNTVPDLIRLLGADEAPRIAESTYDDLFVVVFDSCGKGPTRVVHLKFGTATP